MGGRYIWGRVSRPGAWDRWEEVLQVCHGREMSREVARPRRSLHDQLKTWLPLGG